MIVDEGVPKTHLRTVQCSLLDGLAQCGLQDTFVAIPGATRQTPSSAVVAPLGAVLQKDAQGAIGVGGVDQQPSSPMQPPVTVAELALDPSVAVTFHGSWLSRMLPDCPDRLRKPSEAHVSGHQSVVPGSGSSAPVAR